MLLTRVQFDKRLESGSLNIAFIGMSNIGKSYLSARLGALDGFARIDVDEAIQGKLGLKSMDEMAAWLGHPHEPQYSDNSQTYLQLESEISLAKTKTEQNTVLDTTGSVIHLAAEDQQSIKKQFLMVYLEASPDDLSMLKERYFRYPKPTIWTDALIKKLNGQSSPSKDDVLMHYYPHLLSRRAELYEQLSNITIPAAQFTDGADDNGGILPQIRNALPA